MKYNEMYRLAEDFESKTENYLVAAALYKYVASNCTDSQLIESSKAKLEHILANGSAAINGDIVSDLFRQGNANEIAKFLDREIPFLTFMTISELSALNDKLNGHLIKVVDEEEKTKIKVGLLKTQGYDDYYEYQALSILDENGMANVEKLTGLMNQMGLQGWRLRAAVTNEIGKEALALGVAGLGAGVNSTVDQTVLIFERKVKINIGE